MSGDLVAQLDGVVLVSGGAVVSQPNQELAPFRAWALPLALAADVSPDDRDVLLKRVLEAAGREDLPEWVLRVLDRTESA